MPNITEIKARYEAATEGPESLHEAAAATLIRTDIPMLVTALEEAREIAIQLRDITRTVAANRYGSEGFADEARIRSERADAILGESQ